MAQSVANVLALLRKMFAREQLPEPSAYQPPPPSGRNALGDLFRAETLPEEPVPPPSARRPGLLGVLFRPERLGEDALPPPARQPGVLSLVLGREELPQDPPGPKRQRGRWAAWLFSPERIDPS